MGIGIGYPQGNGLPSASSESSVPMPAGHNMMKSERYLTVTELAAVQALAASSLSEIVGTQTLTATGTALSQAGYFRGIVVRALSGTPQTVTVYDATSATGTPIAVFTVTAVGAYFWDGDWMTPGKGAGGRRQLTAGCHVVISGGTSRTIDVMVEV